MEWALDPSDRLLILQTRPLHVGQRDDDGRKTLPRVEGYPILVEGGATAFPGEGVGTAYHVLADDDLLHFPEGAVLVVKHSSPQFVIVMPKAQAIVTDAGSVTGHMASPAREFGVPTILGARPATTVIAPGTEITVDANSGRVYLGKVAPSYPLLHFKKIGKYWAVGVGLHYRALAVEVERGLPWLRIGSHSEYDRLLGM